MVRALMIAVALAGGPPSAQEREIQEREAFAAQIRSVIERGDVEAFIALLSPDMIICGDGAIPSKQVAAELRKKKGFYPLLFDTSALRASGGASVYPMLSYRDYFKRAKDSVPTVNMDFNTIRWASETPGEVAYPPYFGVERVGRRLRVGLIGDGCH
jgi:hypothetical protein